MLHSTVVRFDLNSDGSRPHLSDIIGKIGDNLILHKPTGLGATTLEINTPRHSIIIETNTPVITGKVSFHADSNLFGVYKGITIDIVQMYIERTLHAHKHIKIMTTPESFYKVVTAFENVGFDLYSEVFLLYDEQQRIVEDVDYRKGMLLPLDHFFRFRHKAFVSATPVIPDDNHFVKQGFNILELKSNYNDSIPINVLLTNNVMSKVRAYIEGHLRQECQPLFVFCNSTEMAFSIARQLGILDRTSIFCSENSVSRLKDFGFNQTYDEFDVELMKDVNFFTSRFYSAFDLLLGFRPDVLIITECLGFPQTMVNPRTDVIQIDGRFRNGLSSLTHISNTDERTELCSRSMAEDIVCLHRIDYERLTTKLHSAPEASAFYIACKEELKGHQFAKFLNSNGEPDAYLISNYIEDKLLRCGYHDFQHVKALYRDTPELLTSVSVEVVPLGDKERLRRQRLAMSVVELRHMIVDQLDLIADLDTDEKRAFLDELREADSLIVDAYFCLGKQMVEDLHYGTKALREALIMHEYETKCTGAELLHLIRNSFLQGHRYTDSFIKKELQRLFSLCNVPIPEGKAISAGLIERYFLTSVPSRRYGRCHVIGEWLLN